jgi:hypothetical protein
MINRRKAANWAVCALVCALCAHTGCALGSKGVDLSKPTSQDLKPGPQTAGDDSTIISPTVAVSGSGGVLLLLGVVLLGWKAWRASGGLKRLVYAIEHHEGNAANVKKTVQLMGGGNGGDAIERLIRCEVEKCNGPRVLGVKPRGAAPPLPPRQEPKVQPLKPFPPPPSYPKKTGDGWDNGPPPPGHLRPDPPLAPPEPKP